MAKKILKSVSGIFGGKKKKAAAPVEGQPIITPLDGAEGSRPGDKFRRKKAAAQISQTILSQTLGGDAFRGKLGG